MFNSHRIGLEHQHGRRFIFFEFQYGGRDVMWKRSVIAMLHFVHQTLDGVFQPVSKRRGVDWKYHVSGDHLKHYVECLMFSS